MILTCMLLALSTSIDSIVIGLTYGIRDITISRQSKIILFIISLIISSISILIGNTLNNILSKEITNIILKRAIKIFFILNNTPLTRADNKNAANSNLF